MIKDFRIKRIDGRLLIEKTFFGIGINLDFKTPQPVGRIRIFVFYFDFLFIRFWFNYYKK